MKYSQPASAVKSLVAVLTLWRGSGAGSSKGRGEAGAGALARPGWSNVGHPASTIALALVSTVSVTLVA